MAPVAVSLLLLTTWALLAAAAIGPLPAIGLAGALGFGLFAAWLGFAGSTRRAAAKADGGLRSQLTQENRVNRRLALYDRVSGLYNRWYLELRLQEEYLRCARYGLSMAVVCMKLGELRLTEMSNDSWGGLASELGRAMAKSVRAVDITAALGPLEFAICLVHCDRTGAESAIARVLQSLDGRPAKVGLAVYPEDDCDGKALIELARRRAVDIDVLGAAHPEAA
ncbi:MAG TPA: diguanylate cyclase [Dehalococcoidia bacterium]|nr:diguanylate cyclase [Dehalococcoidia bacterium]